MTTTRGRAAGLGQARKRDRRIVRIPPFDPPGTGQDEMSSRERLGGHPPPGSENGSPVAVRLRVLGRVQGVGFRPYVLRLAQACQLVGWVKNTPQGVVAHLEG